MEKNGKLQVVTDCCYEVPLLESLQCLLKTDIVKEQVALYKHFNLYNRQKCYKYTLVYLDNEFT